MKTAEEILHEKWDSINKEEKPKPAITAFTSGVARNIASEIESQRSLKEDKWISVETPPKTREQMKDRYFFFVYSFWIIKTEGNISGTGNLILSSRFFPKKFDVNNIASKNVVKNYNVDYSSVDIVIQNFIEMNEIDYLNFNS